MSFQIKYNSEFVIYGAGERCHQICEGLKIMQHSVLCIFDQHADEIGYLDNIPVYKLSEEPTEIKYNKDVIVIISLLNALQHENIAQKLWDSGYRNIVFLPIRYFNLKQTSSLYTVYNALISNNSCDYLGVKCEELPSILMQKSFLENMELMKEDAISLIQLPIEFFFSEKASISNDLSTEIKEKRKISNQFTGGNIISLDPYLNLWRYLETGEGDIKQYMLTQVKSYDEKEIHRVLMDRKKLLELYNYAYECNNEFFLNSPPCVRYIEPCKLEIIDGHHRASYLIYKGHKSLCVNLKKEDFYKLISENIINDIKHLTNRSYYIELPLNKQEMMFYDLDNRFFYYEIAKHIGNSKIGNVVVCCCDYGYIARNMIRLGASKVSDIVKDYDMTLQVNKLFKMDYVDVCMNNNTKLEVIDYLIVDCTMENVCIYNLIKELNINGNSTIIFVKDYIENYYKNEGFTMLSKEYKNQKIYCYYVIEGGINV